MQCGVGQHGPCRPAAVISDLSFFSLVMSDLSKVSCVSVYVCVRERDLGVYVCLYVCCLGVVKDSSRSVFAKNLPFEVTYDDLAGFFSQAGQVSRNSII
jgi:hypothetical protein